MLTEEATENGFFGLSEGENRSGEHLLRPISAKNEWH